MILLGRLDLPADLLILVLIVEMYICHFWLLDTSFCVCVWGLDLPFAMPIWAGTIELCNCHSWPLDASWLWWWWGSSASWSAYMRQYKSEIAILGHWMHVLGVDLPGDLPIWDNTDLKLPFLATGCMYWGGRSARRSAYMSCNVCMGS